MHVNVYFGTCSWLISVYARDILSQLPQLLATCTGVFGEILKINSTKKVCRKLQGASAVSASWCTDVGNEKGEVLVCILMELEGLRTGGPSSHGQWPDPEVCLNCCEIYSQLF